MTAPKLATPAEALTHAADRFRAGDMAAAELLCRRIVAAAPTLAEAHHLLGLVLWRTGRAVAAVDSLRAALAATPDGATGPGAAALHHHLGLALAAGGDLAAAATSLADAARMAPADAEIQADLGAALARSGAEAPALAAFRRALTLAPRHAGAGRNLAALLSNRASRHLRDGAPVLALEALAEAEDAAPGSAEVALRRGMALAALKRWDAAAEAYRAAATGRPDDPEPLNNLAEALFRMGRDTEAEAAAEQALALAPAMPEALVNLAAVLHRTGRLDAARDTLTRAVEASRTQGATPTRRAALVNLGNLLSDLDDHDGAEARYGAALSHHPGDAEIHWLRAQARLRVGDLAGGWDDYEWRWRTGRLAIPVDLERLPAWDGGDLQGQRLLVHAEQGHGDTLQFVRYLPLLLDRGAVVGITAQPALVRLLRQSLPAAVAVLPSGTEANLVAGGAWDLRCPLLSLPHRFETRLHTIPATVPYLLGDPGEVAAWRDRLAGVRGLKVGLVWAGDPRRDDPDATIVDRRRSLDPADLEPLAGLAGVCFVSLQKGQPPDRVASVASRLGMIDMTAELTDFAATAALVEALDVVVGVDTAVIHLAGGLDRPTLCLSRFDGCWRWLTGRDDSPWYPSLTLIRQARWGDWKPCLETVASHLSRLRQS